MNKKSWILVLIVGLVGLSIMFITGWRNYAVYRAIYNFKEEVGNAKDKNEIHDAVQDFLIELKEKRVTRIDS